VNVPVSTPTFRKLIGRDPQSTQAESRALNTRYLEAGDIVVVSEAESAFIIGAVLQPQQMVLESVR